MATPTYSDIKRFSSMARELSKGARAEFERRAAAIDYTDWSRASDELRALCRDLVRYYGMASSTLGAQWYDYCRRLAIGDGPPAQTIEPNEDVLAHDMENVIHGMYAGETPPDQMAGSMGAVVEKHVHGLTRATVSAALRSDYEANVRRGLHPSSRYRWTRVAVGDTCAFCTMLASRGAVYLSRESALSAKFHDDCDCVVLPFSDAGDISGYEGALRGYNAAYYGARSAIENDELPDELRERIAEAKERHNERYEAGEVGEPWQQFNETLMVMRWQNPGMH